MASSKAICAQPTRPSCIPQARKASSSGMSLPTQSNIWCTPTCRKGKTLRQTNSSNDCTTRSISSLVSRPRFTSLPRRHATHSSGGSGRRRRRLPLARLPISAGDSFMWAEATACFARGMGAAHLGKLNDVTSTLKRLAELERVARAANEDLFARNIKILDLELTAWSTQAQGQREKAVEVMREAASLEAATPKHAVTPAPTLPASELLGDPISSNRTHRRSQGVSRSLQRYPRRFHSLRRVPKPRANPVTPRNRATLYDEFLEVAGAGSRNAAIDEARHYLITSAAATAHSGAGRVNSGSNLVDLLAA